MRVLAPRHWLLPATGAALLLCSSNTHAATGARVLLQVWNPATPDQANVVTLSDEPTLVSDSLKDAWSQVRPKICEQIKGRLGVGGAANGQTLYDITCLLDEQAVFEIKAAGQNTLSGSFAVGGYLEATSTTPTALGSYADPRVSIAVRAKLDLTVVVQADREHTLRVTQARFTLSNATLDSHNFVGDVLAFVAEDLIPFFGGPNFKNLAENAVNAVSIDFASRFDNALAPVNVLLKGPSDAVRVGVAASEGYIKVAFAPREFAPQTTGSMSGLLRWDPTSFTPRSGCQSFDIRATVQTGPVPMFTANAEAPTRQLGVFQASPASPGSCAFTLTGLAVGWPNYLSARVVDGSSGRSAGSSLYSVSYSLAGDGWDGRKVIPQPVASQRNYLVARSIDAAATATQDFSAREQVLAARVNPVVNPADSYTSQVTHRVSPEIAMATTDSIRIGDTVSLNPQPLPPGPDAEPAQNLRMQPGAAQSGISIEGAVNPLAQELSATSRVFAPVVVAPVVTRTQSLSQPVPAADLEALAAKGPEITGMDPLALLLRASQGDGPRQRGFDIGMAAAEGQTLPGPGKQRIQDSLGAREQLGFAAAVAFSLERNRNQKLAATGAAIAGQDDIVAAARTADPDAFFQLGFDIASGIFGDPALGALGNTLTGPGSLGIRNALSAAGQRGFNASVTLHLSRDYHR